VPRQSPRAEPPTRGFFVSLRRVGATLLAILHSRAELLARELEREQVRITRLVLLGIAALFFLTLGAITATVFIIVLFWDSQRLVVIGFLTLLYLGLGLGILSFARKETEAAKRPFSATLEELRKDRDHFSRH
jgi:uncharacterized membrane protein YqjE